MKEYGTGVWPLFGNAIVAADGMKRSWLQQLLDRDNSFSNQQSSALSVLPIELIISWCHDNEEVGPSFVAGCINVFETVGDKKEPTDLFVALLENFGDNEHIRRALSANLGSRGCSGSLVPYLKSDKEALEPLLRHSNNRVRGWVKEYIVYVDRQVERESMRDDEEVFGIY